jgi:hypothetical protein
MKLVDDKQYVEHDLDIIELIEQLKEKNRTVYWIHLDGQLYVYKPLGRRDYKEISEDESISTMDKEDEVMKRTLLHPDPKTFDLDDMPAGIINKLFTTIMENSFLADLESRTAIMTYYRQEMYDLNNQIPCIINEAFPQYDIEDIENWDVERTSKYLSRAEWKLQNFRGMEFNYDMIEQQEAAYDQGSEEENEASYNVSPAQKQPQQHVNQQQETIKTKKRETLTPEKLAELKRKFPEINWEADTVAMEGMSGMADSVDVVSPALRVGGR